MNSDINYYAVEDYVATTLMQEGNRCFHSVGALCHSFRGGARIVLDVRMLIITSTGGNHNEFIISHLVSEDPIAGCTHVRLCVHCGYIPVFALQCFSAQWERKAFSLELPPSQSPFRVTVLGLHKLFCWEWWLCTMWNCTGIQCDSVSRVIASTRFPLLSQQLRVLV